MGSIPRSSFPEISSPSSQISPASGESRPTRCLMRTLLPTPDAPMTKRISPSLTSTFTPERTAFDPNALWMFLKWITTARPRRAPRSYARNLPRRDQPRAARPMSRMCGSMVSSAPRYSDSSSSVDRLSSSSSTARSNSPSVPAGVGRRRHLLVGQLHQVAYHGELLPHRVERLARPVPPLRALARDPHAALREGARMRPLHEARGFERADVLLEGAPVDRREALAADVVGDREAHVAREQIQALVDRELGGRSVGARRVADPVDDPLEAEQLPPVVVGHLEEEGGALLGGVRAVDLVEPLVHVAAEGPELKHDSEENELGAGEDQQEDQDAPVGHAEDSGTRQHDDVPRVHERMLDVHGRLAPAPSAGALEGTTRTGRGGGASAGASAAARIRARPASLHSFWACSSLGIELLPSPCGTGQAQGACRARGWTSPAAKAPASLATADGAHEPRDR